MYNNCRHSFLLSATMVIAGWAGLPSAEAQVLTRIQTEFDGFPNNMGTPIPGVTVEGITGAFDVTLSPDGAHVYVIGSLPDAGGSLAVFSRDNDDLSGTFGEVTFIEAYFDDGIIGGTIDGLKSARAVVVSPDGKHVYAVALTDSSIVVFSRNTTVGVDFGKLTFVETHKDGVMGVDGLGGAHGVTVSTGGEHLYVASRAEDAVAVFSRDDSTGMLTFVEAHKDLVGPVTGLADAERLTLSPDGKHLYVASEGADSSTPGSVAVFSRNIDTMTMDFGKLTFVESHTDGVNGADGLLNANDVAVSPDGKHVYVSNVQLLDESEDWLGIFSRDDTTGALTFISKLNASAADLCSSSFEPGGIASEVVISPDGKTVIASNPWKGAVVSFNRNLETGSLTGFDPAFPIADMECDEAGDEGIVTINAVAMGADGKHVYTTGLGAPASLVFLTSVEGTLQPDGHIGKKLSSLRGDDVYNTTGTGQKITLVSKRLRTAKFQGRLENDGTIGDRVSLQGTRGNNKFKFTYLLDGANVTSEMGQGTLERLLNSGEFQNLQLKAKPSRKLKNKRTGRIKRKKRNITITATSVIDGTKADVVKGTVKAK